MERVILYILEGVVVILRNITKYYRTNKTVSIKVNPEIWEQFSKFCKENMIAKSHLLNLILLSFLSGQEVKTPRFNINVNLNLNVINNNNVVVNKENIERRKAERWLESVRERWQRLQETVKKGKLDYHTKHYAYTLLDSVERLLLNHQNQLTQEEKRELQQIHGKLQEVIET